MDLNDHIPDNPEWDLNYATSINDAGQIVGIGTLGGHTRGFLLTPVQTAPTAVDDAYAHHIYDPLDACDRRRTRLHVAFLITQARRPLA